MKSGLISVVTLAALLGGCIPAPDERDLRPQRQASVSLPSNDIIRACTGALDRIGAKYSLLPDRYSGSCSAVNAVRLTSVGVPVTNLTATQCGIAQTFASWVRVAVQKAARDAFGERVIRVETMGSYSCRSVKGVASRRLSEHASANAIDVSGFVLADGRRITLEEDWNSNGQEANFLRSVRDSACQRFHTVLSPDYNAAHYNHLHFDMGRGPYCR